MRTTRVQIEGTEGILAILNRASQETAQHFNSRTIDKLNELQPQAVRMKLMGQDNAGHVQHDTVRL